MLFRDIPQDIRHIFKLSAHKDSFKDFINSASKPTYDPSCVVCIPPALFRVSSSTI